MKNIIPWLGVVVFVTGCSGGATEEPAPTDPGAPPATDLTVVPGEPAATAPAGATLPPPPTGTAPPKTPGETATTGAFAGAPAYVATLGPSTIDTSGKGNGHLSFSATGNPAGQSCLNCHDGAGKGGAPAFLFAGTVYEDKAATKPAARVEVRMVGAEGKGLSTYTDVNGNFFFREGEGAFTPPAIAGARTATITRLMSNKINDANCNQCHGATTRITL